MRFGLKTFLLMGMFIAILQGLRLPFGKILRGLPPFFYPLALFFLILLLKPVPTKTEKDEQKVSSKPTKKAFPEELLLFPLLVLTLSFFLLTEGQADKFSKRTIQQLEEHLSVKSKDAWGEPFQKGPAGFYSKGPDRFDNGGYYDDIGPALSLIDTQQKKIRFFWLYHRNFFLFFVFGILYILVILIVHQGKSFLQKNSEESPANEE